MKSFHLEIMTPQRVFYRGESVSLIVPTTDGMLGIMANREPLTSSLTRGEAYYTKPDGEKILFSISGGMIDVENNTVKDFVNMPCFRKKSTKNTNGEKWKTLVLSSEKRRANGIIFSLG